MVPARRTMKFWIIPFWTLLLLLGSSCSSENAFELLDPPSTKQRGESALARGDYESAIKDLEKALQDNPSDPQVRQMLANAYMSRTGVDTLKIIQTISEGQEATEWGVLIAAMPIGTDANQADLQRAVALLEAIPPGERSSGESYQLAMAQTSLAVVTAKKYGINESGQIQDDQIDLITDGDAELIVGQLEGASSNLAGVNEDGASQGAEKIQSVTDSISNSEGESDSERLRSFLRSESQSSQN